jgi:hypothetical protein
MPITVTTAAGARCPGTTPINTNVQLTSTHRYSINNQTDQDAMFTIVARLADSRGNENSQTDNNVTVAARSSHSDSLTVLLVAAYSPSGTVHVTATTTVSGAASDSARGQCSFQVIGL